MKCGLKLRTYSSEGVSLVHGDPVSSRFAGWISFYNASTRKSHEREWYCIRTEHTSEYLSGDGITFQCPFDFGCVHDVKSAIT